MINFTVLVLEALKSMDSINEAIPLTFAKNTFGRKHAPQNYTEEMNKAFNGQDRIILQYNANTKFENESEIETDVRNQLFGNLVLEEGDEFIRQKYGITNKNISRELLLDTEEKIKAYNDFIWERTYIFDHNDYVEGFAYKLKTKDIFLESVNEGFYKYHRLNVPQEKDEKQKFKIGRVLQKLNKLNVLDEFKKDESRQLQHKEFVVVISRHPYDIAGASDDRSWTSCISRYYVPIVYKDKKERTGNGEYKKRKYIDKYKQKFNRQEKADKLSYQKEVISERSIIAYLVPKEELLKNGKIALRRPVSRMLFEAVKGTHDFHISDSDCPVYGAYSVSFFNQVIEWLSSHFVFLADWDTHENLEEDE